MARVRSSIRRPTLALAALVALDAFVAVATLGTVGLGCADSERPAFDDATGPEGGAFATSDAALPPASGEVYGHTDTALYRVDTATHAVTAVGDFTGCTHVADIAIDESSNMYASTGSELYVIENNTARCTRVRAGTFPNSLSFVPRGVLDPNRETLVGYNGGEYVRIDAQSGEVLKVGDLGGGFESSGDVVSVNGGKSFLTVKGPSCADCLVEIDPKTGAMTKNYGSLGHVDAFGLAYWGGDLYAFTDDGKLLLVKIAGDVLGVQVLPIPDAPPALSFRGAGSTTSAPVGPVR